MQQANLIYNLGIIALLPLITSGQNHMLDNFVKLDCNGQLGQFKLECYVKDLKLPIYIKLDNSERAHCTNIYPSSSCHHYDPIDSIDQNLTSNITTYIMGRSDPALLNGRWFCIHGQFNSSCVVEIHGNYAESCVIAFLSEFAAFFVSFLTTFTVLQFTTHRDNTTAPFLVLPIRLLSCCSSIVLKIRCQRITEESIHIGVKIVLCSLLSLVLLLAPLIPYYSTVNKYLCIPGYVITGTVLGPLLVVLLHTKESDILQYFGESTVYNQTSYDDEGQRANARVVRDADNERDDNKANSKEDVSNSPSEALLPTASQTNDMHILQDVFNSPSEALLPTASQTNDMHILQDVSNSPSEALLPTASQTNDMHILPGINQKQQRTRQTKS